MAVESTTLESRKQGEYSRDVLHSPEIRQCIQLMRDLVHSSFGPNGKLKSIQNSSGGHLILTSNSQRLFSALTLSKPVLKLLVGSVQRHLTLYGDGGLFCALLSLSLIDRSLSLTLPRFLIVDVLDSLLSKAVEYLNSESCNCKVDTGQSNLDTILKLTRSIVGTKPLCTLHGDKVDFLSQLLVETFLKSLPDNPTQSCRPDNVHFMADLGHPVTKSKLFCGILLDTFGRDISLLNNAQFTADNISANGSLPVVVVGVSMSGDLDDYVQDVSYEVSSEINIDKVSSEKLLHFAKVLSKLGARVVFCQKVTSPEVKVYLKTQDILVIDRLGGNGCKLVQRITGATRISSISTQVDESFLGNLASISVEEIHGKSYLLLTSLSATDVTVILCSGQEEMAEEQKVLCESAIQALYLNLHQPQVLSGGGCWQTILASYLRQKVMKSAEEMSLENHCTKAQLYMICEVFCASLELCAIAIGQEDECHMVNLTNHHLWRGGRGNWDMEGDDVNQTCSCGEFCRGEVAQLRQLTDRLCSVNSVPQWFDRVNKQRIELSDGDSRNPDKVKVLDSFPVQLNALQTAVMTACAVLSINQYIKDTN